VILGDGTVAGKPGDGRGGGWNDPPASRYYSSPRGSLPRKRVPYPLEANNTPSRTLTAELMKFIKTVSHLLCVNVINAGYFHTCWIIFVISVKKVMYLYPCLFVCLCSSVSSITVEVGKEFS